MNLKREIKTIKGDTYPMSFPSASDLEKIKAEKNIKDVKLDDLPKETVGNVILNCISEHDVKTNKEVFTINAIAQWVMGNQIEPLSEDLRNFLAKSVLPGAVSRVELVEGKPTNKGLYKAWVMAQVYDELGIKE